MATSFANFMNPKVTQWIFVKPNPTLEFADHVKTTFDNNKNITYTAIAICRDDTGNPFLQGFVKTTDPIDTQTVIDAFGPMMYTPCYGDEHENPILIEILINKSVFEFGNIKSKDFKKKKKEIRSLRCDTSIAMTKVVREIRTKHPIFFRCTPHLVLSYLQSPSKASKIGYPPSFKEDADQAVLRALEGIEHQHPDLFQAHPKAVHLFLVT